MNKKACIAGGLATLGAAVWGPQLLGGSSHEPVLVEEVAADGGGGAGSSLRAGGFGGFESAGAASASRQEPDSSPSDEEPFDGYEEYDEGYEDEFAPGAGDPEDLLVRLEDTLGLMESFVPSGKGRDLRSLVQDLHDTESAGSAPAARGPLEVAMAEGPGEVLRAFASEHPLRGVLHGPDRSMVLLGHRVVSVGDRLDGGRVTLEAIGPDGVRLGAGGESLEVALPPFVAGGSSSSSDDDEYQDGESGGEDEVLVGGEEGGA